MGYVGVVSGACFAKMGHSVIGVDVHPEKVALINAGQAPIKEKGLDELFGDVSRTSGSFSATLRAQDALATAELVMVCVRTPSLKDGRVDLSAIQAVAGEIGQALADRPSSSPLSIAIRSTVPPTTTRSVVLPILEKVSGKRHGQGFSLCHHPEFLREGTSIEDFFNPPKIVVGEDAAVGGAQALHSLYSEFPAPKLTTSFEVSELVKYCDNTFHALKVTFANEVGLIAQSLGIDSREVMRIFCLDTKLNISPAYLKPGFAFGGSCLPKDLRALIDLGRQRGFTLPMLSHILASNASQIEAVLQRILSSGIREVGLIGLSFKPDTDDLRESPMVELAERLIGKGIRLSVYDNYVSLSKLMGANKAYRETHLPHLSSLLVDTVEALIARSKLVIIANGKVPVDALAAAPDLRIYDLVGNRPELARHPGYQGLYW